MKKHANIPIFIPHLGCPNQCVFCNQRKITGVESFSASKVRTAIEEALSTITDGVEVEIAFFGGSFTGIDRDLMIELLTIANSYVKSGAVSSIRCSTRPDYISPEILDILREYNVNVIKLGLQSSDDTVLLATKRGHNFEAEKHACKLILEQGFELVGQMMIGLPGSSIESEEKTAKFIIESGATAARIYPTVVFRETELCDMQIHGDYEALSEEDAIIRSAKVLKIFRDAGVSVIRIGLCASENLSDKSSYYSGPNHPALGELVENEYYYNKIIEYVDKYKINPGSYLTVAVSPGSLSKAIGQSKRNKLRLISNLKPKYLQFVEDKSLPEHAVDVRIGERNH